MHHGLLINLAGIASVPLGGIIGAGGRVGPWQPDGSLLVPTPPTFGPDRSKAFYLKLSYTRNTHLAGSQRLCALSTVRDLITIQHKIIILGVTTAHYLSFLNFQTSSYTYFSIKNSLFACVCSRKFRIIERIRKTCHIIIFQTLFSGL